MSNLFRNALTRGMAMVERGNVADGLGLLIVAVGEVDVDPRDYDALMQSLRHAFTLTQRWRCLASVAWYLGDVRDERLFQLPPPVDVARSHRMRGDEASAAGAFEDAGLLAHAAIARERARDPRAARALWSRLAHRLGSTMTSSTDDASGRGADI